MVGYDLTKNTIRHTAIVARYIENLKNMGVPVDRVYLFGSQARLDAGKDSDLDLAVISPLFEKMSFWDRAGYLGKAVWGDTLSDGCYWVFAIADHEGGTGYAFISHIENRA